MANNSKSNGAVARRPRFSEALATDGYRSLIARTLGDESRAKRFVASISSAVAVNPDLQRCDVGTILSGALLGESLNLSPSPQLGQYYLVPFEDRKNNRTAATFVLGYKGYVQLALRSGQYRKLNVVPIKKGELKRYDPLNEEIEVNFIEDELERETAETVGYFAFFEYMNGFRKTLYWSKRKMKAHAKRYSKSFHSEHSFWQRDFDAMAMKTMLRQLISKWGIMSFEMQTAYASDGAVMASGAGSETAVEYLTGHDIGDMAAAIGEAVSEAVDEAPSGAAEAAHEKQPGEEAGAKNGAQKAAPTLEDI